MTDPAFVIVPKSNSIVAPSLEIMGLLNELIPGWQLFPFNNGISELEIVSSAVISEQSKNASPESRESVTDEDGNTPGGIVNSNR